VDTEWILPEGPKESMISDVKKRVQQEYGSKVPDEIDFELVVLEGHVSSKIISFLEENEVDLVITGSYGASGMGLVIFGSVANRVARKAPCSVMIVREKGEKQ
jgi:universal stress protein A